MRPTSPLARPPALIGALALIGAVACNDTTAPSIAAPTNLTYELQPSGDPSSPAGIILSWDAVTDPALQEYRVYSRRQDGAAYDLLGSTISTTFHEAGNPDLDYEVTAVATNGDESAPSVPVRVDQRLRLESPATLSSTSLDQAILLYWSDNPFLDDTTGGFKQYRVYSASYSLDTGLCGTTWTLEGTTISPEFLASALTNGVSRCFGISAESVEGWESLWSPLAEDTPRPDARNVLIYPFQAKASQSGFRFFQDLNGNGQVDANELGLVMAGNDLNADFWVDRDSTGVWITPVRSGTSVALYGTTPVEDLTSIDVAPTTGYATSAIEAVPRYGYVFQMSGGDGYARFGAIRVTYVGQQYMIFDWSYQTDPGNPELQIHGGLPSFEGIVVRPSR